MRSISVVAMANSNSEKQQQQTNTYLTWQLERLKEEHEESCKYWENQCLSKSRKIDSLEDKILDLQEQLKPSIKKDEELKQKLKVIEKELQANEEEKSILEERNNLNEKRHRRIQLGLEQQLSDAHESYKQSLAELTQQKDNAISRMQVEFDRKLALQKQNAELALKEEAEKHERDMTKLKEQLSQVEEENKKVLAKLRNELAHKEEIIVEERKKHEAARFENRLEYKALEMKLEKKEQTIKELKSRPNLATTVTKLKVTLAAKSTVVENKSKEIAVLKKEKKDIQDNWCREKDSNAILLLKLNDLIDNNARLENELAEEVARVKETLENMNSIKRFNSELTETVRNLRYKVKASEPHLKKKSAQIRHLETQQLRLKEDLQACISVIDEPKKLRSRLIVLKKRYLESDGRVQMDEETKVAFQLRVKFLKDKIGCCDRIHQNKCSELRMMHVRLEKSFEHLDDTRRFFIKLLNEKIQEVHELKKELKETNMQLKKATKPAQKKVSSWINKKVLQAAPAGLELAEESPSLYPDTWQPLGHPDDNITSSVHSCTDGTPSSSHGCTTVQVQPFVDNGGVTPVDI